MNSLLANLIAMSVAGSVVVGLMLIFRPITEKIFPAKWQYRVGKMAIVFFLLPVFPILRRLSSTVLETINPNHFYQASFVSLLHSNSFAVSMGQHLPTLMEKYLAFEVIKPVFCIWVVGGIIFAGWHFYCYYRFIKQLEENSIPIPKDTAATILLSSCKMALGIQGEVKLMLNPKIKSPMLVGLCRPMILMPTISMQQADLKLILTHELVHLKHKDLWVKMLTLLVGTLHWFNPLAHILRKDISIWHELACDETLAVGMSHNERKFYGQIILNTLDNYSSINSTFCSSLCGSRKHIERRLIMLLNDKKMKKHIVVLAFVAIVLIASIGTGVSALAWGNSSNTDDFELAELIADEKNQDSFTKEIKEIPKAKTGPLTEYIKVLSPEEISDTEKFEMGTVTLISVKLSDQGKFTPEQWEEILVKIESGEIMLEAE